MAGINERRAINILLVEDDDGDAKALQRAFRKIKIANTIFRATDGVEALEILKGSHDTIKIQHPFLLLVDINMPRMNGIELIQTLRNDQEFHNTIIFVLTTSKLDEDKVAAYNLNVAGYVVKEMAGDCFLNLINLMDYYWRIVEIP